MVLIFGYQRFPQTEEINQNINPLVNFSYSFIECNDNVIFQLWKLLIINIILFCSTKVHTLNVILGLLMQMFVNQICSFLQPYISKYFIYYMKLECQIVCLQECLLHNSKTRHISYHF